MTKLKGKWFIGLLCLVILALSGGALALKTLSSKQQMPKELVILSPNSQTILTSTIPAFEEKYGIKVRLIQGGTGQLIDQLRQKNKQLKADIFFGGNYTQFESHKDLFKSYVSPQVATVISDYQLPSHRATPYTINGSVLIVNNELAQGLTITSYEDLLQPALKGKIAFADPNSSSSAFSQLTNILLAKGGYTNADAWAYMKRLLVNMNSIRATSSSEVYQSVAEGKMIVGLTYEDPCINLQKSGANVSIVYPKEGTVFVPSSVAIIKHAPNMTEAKLFINFMLSRDVQNAFGQSTSNRPIRQDAQTSHDMKALEAIATLKEDYAYVTKHKKKIVATYNQLRQRLEKAK
ncbi:extracellular solute-binding protein [Streptococcus pyogenes]|uniref:extracellular solute-binding protein n=1 Tax=Streptococcus pyogenes TaxID=1314 RepID=UPI00109BACEF|nr:extracellular solute-binding protein [Streptococcus pyogenes]HER4615299.1 extracellular solute-binding protein [Streptococcus pyogenes NGAS535]VGQ16293.1 bacterial extracellular solute-binding family protein [Streptococcus pyogenes]VGQ54096.1 bacterial extracellular solute-binding family protein [Streptococcus pyogenes]VGQ83177.1 bacterial extracellular solute-binding family protein [Streptococcus pyogenes]VGR54275.1 bacterial extracellular solute-binding family protein [Streptococcus pyoge